MTTKVIPGLSGGPAAIVQVFELDPATTVGLTFGYKAGRVWKTPTLTSIAAGTVALTANATNIIYINYTGTPIISSTVSTSKPTQVDAVFLYIVTTNAGGITDVIDLRNWTGGRVGEFA